MKVKIIPIMLLLLIFMATPVAVSMAIPEDATEFVYKAVMEPYYLTDTRGVQKYDQIGVLYEGEKEVGTIYLDILITNADKYLRGGTARPRVHFFMDFDEGPDINGTIFGKTWIDAGVQYVEGKFVGRGSHVKGTVSMPETNVLLFEGKEW